MKTADTGLENAVIKEFYKSRENYGTRKLQRELRKQKYRVSRRKIGKVMAKYELVSKYTIRNRKKRLGGEVNKDEIGNIVNREFTGRPKHEVVVSDLTYVKIGGVWRYLCLLLDLCGRKIVNGGEKCMFSAVTFCMFSAASMYVQRIVKTYHSLPRWLLRLDLSVHFRLDGESNDYNYVRVVCISTVIF
jgi:hypothetical protein